MAIKQYILQLADDSAFTTGVVEEIIDVAVSPLEFLETGLAPNTTRYGRYRAEDFGGNLSPWSAIVSATTEAFSPGAISSIWAYFEADSYSLSDGANVTSNWRDKSGNGRHGVITGTPTFETNELNGQPIIRFGADSNDYLTLPSMAALTAGTIIEVLKVTNVTTDGGNRLGSASDASHYPYFNGTIYDGFGTTARKNDINAAITLLNNWHVLRIHSATNDWGMFQNGSAAFTTATNTVGFASVPLIGSNGTQFMKFDLAGLYLFSTKINSGEITDMGGYINSKFGV
jgi:hypothetical protein